MVCVAMTKSNLEHTMTFNTDLVINIELAEISNLSCTSVTVCKSTLLDG